MAAQFGVAVINPLIVMLLPTFVWHNEEILHDPVLWRDFCFYWINYFEILTLATWPLYPYWFSPAAETAAAEGVIMVI